MEPPFGFDLYGECTHVLKLNKSLYSLKKSSINWLKTFTQGLEDIDVVPSCIYPYICYKKNCIVLIYFDDCIVFSIESLVIEHCISSLQNGKEKEIFTDKGELENTLVATPAIYMQCMI